MRKEVKRFHPDVRQDFYRVHCEKNEGGWCNCVAWWIPTWELWAHRTAEQNLAIRDQLLDRGEYDGYLLYVDEEPVGWCQAGPRDRLVKLTRQYGLAPEPDTWAITCFLLAPSLRHQGLASYFLRQVVRDVLSRAVPRIEAFPRRGTDLSEGEVWTGPEAMYLAEGFRVVRDDPERPVLCLESNL